MTREMKNSGVRWIGEIPKDWGMLPNKYIMHKIKQICPIYNGEDILSLSVRGVNVRNLDAGGKMPTTFNGYQRVYKGNLLMCLFDMDVTPCCIGRIKNDGLTSPAYSQFVVHKDANMDYYYYYYLMLDNTKELVHLAKNLRHSLTEEQLGNIKLPLPPFSEQKAIADFLDAKCVEIDGLLSDLDAEINVLQDYKKSIIAEVTTQGLNPNVKMKPSGIDWIGEIPAHWQVVPFRSYVVERSEKNLGGRNQNLLALSFALGVTRYADKKYNMDRVKDDFSGYQIVHEKDLVLSPNDIIKGSIFVSEYKGCISPMYRVFSNYDQNTYNLYYLSYHLRTKESGRKFFYIARGLIGEMLDNGKYVTRRMSVSQQDLLKFKVLLPPIEEQNEIVRYLDLKCASIEQAIKDKNNQIETLKAYKSSLIYEYVTGKKQVL